MASKLSVRGLLNQEEAADCLEELIENIKQGSIVLKNQSKEVRLEPANNLTFSFSASIEKDKHKVSFSLRWRPQDTTKHPVLQISSGQPQSEAPDSTDSTPHEQPETSPLVTDEVKQASTPKAAQAKKPLTKKTTSKKKTVSKKKASAKKATSKKKVASKAKTVAKKKVAAKKKVTTKKKTATKKKATAKKKAVTAKKTPVAKKKVTRSKKTTAKKSATKKTTTKKTSKKRATGTKR